MNEQIEGDEPDVESTTPEESDVLSPRCNQSASSLTELRRPLWSYNTHDRLANLAHRNHFDTPLRNYVSILCRVVIFIY